MGKVVAAIAGVALIATGIGAAAGAAIFGVSLATAAASVSVLGVSLATISTIGVVAGLAGAALNAIGLSGGGGGTNPASTIQSRLNATIEPSTPRKIVFGRTAMATDVRYQAFTGTDQEYYHQIVCCASHKATSIEELWLDQELAWSSASGIATKFSGYLSVVAVLEGSSANAVNIDGNWNATNGCRLTGCAYLWIKYKRTGATKDSDSPFASSITTRMTIIGKGIPVYDARFDSTRGGSGTMRADDQTTWGFTYGATEIGRNPAAQISTFMLGWKIGGKLAVGCGMPANRIAWPRKITSANACDEAVTLAAGGTEPRYRTDFIVSEGDDRGATFGLWKASANALLRDAGGLIAFDVIVNDIASPIASFTEDDVLSAGTWKQSTPLTDYRNVVRGRYTDARPSSLFQLVDWPQIALISPDGIDRILSLDFPAVQSASQVQRLAKQVLQRLQAGGVLQLVLGARAWALQIGDPMRLTFWPLGFTNKAFRVAELQVAVDGQVAVTLTEEQSAFYTWLAEDIAPVTLPTPTTYNWANDPLVSQIGTVSNATQRLNATTGAAETNFIGADGRSYARLAEMGAARDGDVVSFAAALPAVPQMAFLPGGNSGTAGQNIKIIAEGLTVTGFTMRAKSQSVTAGSTVTDSGSSAGSGGEPQRVINRSSGSAPFDGRFRFTFTATIGTIAIGEPGYIQLGLFVKQSGVWVQVSSQRRGGSGGTITVDVSPGSVDFGAGSEFGMSLILEEGGSTFTFDSVAYTPGTVTETSLTPTGASPIPWQAWLP